MFRTEPMPTWLQAELSRTADFQRGSSYLNQKHVRTERIMRGKLQSTLSGPRTFDMLRQERQKNAYSTSGLSTLQQRTQKTFLFFSSFLAPLPSSTTFAICLSKLVCSSEPRGLILHQSGLQRHCKNATCMVASYASCLRCIKFAGKVT